ncbi:NlpC/P60 family protein [Rhodococcus sp. WS4]|nr:NlpC/P60 family protein [Rhodococcus sp. WS4]
METGDAENAAMTSAVDAGAGGTILGGGEGGGRPTPRLSPAAIAQASHAPMSMPVPAMYQQMSIPQPSMLQNAAALAAPLVNAAISAPAAAPSFATGSSRQIALTPDQQERFAEAIEGMDAGSSSSSSGSLDLNAGGNLTDITKALIAADIPYAWGGGTLEGPSKGVSDGGAADAHGDYNKTGFDCSGLSRYVHYQMTGEEVPRTSEAQYAVGKEVSLNEVKPGDFVYPKSSFGVGGPGHVQIYLGDGKVLEAPQSGDKVKISDMTPSLIKRM